jgi:zinc transporter ZupT
VKASPIMAFEYAGMLGVPALLVVLAVFSLAGVTGALGKALLLVIAAGCVVYGAIAVREVYGHARRPSRKEES